MAELFAQLCKENDQSHRRILEHAAVNAIGDGSLSDDRFRFYLEQDHHFLREYIRVLAHAVAVADELEDAAWLSDLLHGTIAVEIDAVSRLHQAFGGELSSLALARRDPVCEAYVNHLLARAADGNLLVIFASILPCQWGYREIARTLSKRSSPDDPRFQRWIGEYLAPEYSLLVDRMIAALDKEALLEDARTRDNARNAFAASMRHELRFWDMVMSV